MTVERLAFLLLWCKRSGMGEKNARSEWNQAPEWERQEMRDWARCEMTPTEEKAA